MRVRYEWWGHGQYKGWRTVSIEFYDRIVKHCEAVGDDIVIGKPIHIDD
jgi:hypothetical protein